MHCLQLPRRPARFHAKVRDSVTRPCCHGNHYGADFVPFLDFESHHYGADFVLPRLEDVVASSDIACGEVCGLPAIALGEGTKPEQRQYPRVGGTD